MKRYIAILTVLCAVSLSASAQVAKQVEVTRDYKPRVQPAQKMEIAPTEIDTMTMKPEIDYTITPRSFPSKLGTHRFNPATATYWEYQRRYPFYLKLGVGYPLNSVGDLYATAHRAGVGYVTGYANHYGSFSNIAYDNGDGTMCKNNRSMQTNNRFGAMGGKYFGRYTLAGDLSYGMDIYHRYPLNNNDYKKRLISYEDVKFVASFGDTFADYSHLNFKAYALFDYYHDKSEQFVQDHNLQQIDANAGITLAREITSSSSLSLDLNYQGFYGLRSLKEYQNTWAGATLMYRYRSGGMVDVNAGVKLYYDYNAADVEKPKGRWHGFPVVNVSLNILDGGVAVPYVEADGKLQNNSYYSLVKQNPYVAMLGENIGFLQAGKFIPNTDIYNVRFGVSGHVANSKFAYRFYANMSFMLNSLYWYNVNQIFFDAVTANRNIWSLCAAIDYRPISQLLISAQVSGSLYNNKATTDITIGDRVETVNLAGGMPDYEALLKVQYNHSKFSVGMNAELCGPIRWTAVQNDALFTGGRAQGISEFKSPIALDLSVYGDYRINKTCMIYLEGNNLLGDVLPTYRWAFYRELGASFTVGVKVQF